MSTEEKIEVVIAWANDNIDKFPKEFKLSVCETVKDGRKCIEKQIAELGSYRDSKNYGVGFRAAYFRMVRLKKWLTEYESKDALEANIS